jgi:3-deoxy-D-manno-octulosonic acid (KDO) 8-phosphate synthase
MCFKFAFLRQTDLVVAANTGKIRNLKGQFMSPESMKHAVQKVLDCNNTNVMVTDRGTMFGYQDMIVDFRGFQPCNNYIDGAGCNTLAANKPKLVLQAEDQT